MKYTYLIVVLLICQPVAAEDKSAVISKNVANTFFSMSKYSFGERAKRIHKAGQGVLVIGPVGEKTIKMRPPPGFSVMKITPFYLPTNHSRPWKINVVIETDREPAKSLYHMMPHQEVYRTVWKSAKNLIPEYTVTGYMIRTNNSKKPPAIRFTLYKAGDFLFVDNLTKKGKVCPIQGDEQVCIQTEKLD